MQNVSGVGCDTAEELIIRGTEQVGDGRQIFVAVAKPLAATLKTETQITNKNKKWCGGGGGGSSSSSIVVVAAAAAAYCSKLQRVRC